MKSEPRKGKPIVRWGRKVMDLPYTDHIITCQTARLPKVFSSVVFFLLGGELETFKKFLFSYCYWFSKEMIQL